MASPLSLLVSPDPLPQPAPPFSTDNELDRTHRNAEPFRNRVCRLPFPVTSSSISNVVLPQSWSFHFPSSEKPLRQLAEATLTAASMADTLL